LPKRCRGARLLGVEAAEAATNTLGISSDRLRARPAEAGEYALELIRHRGGESSRGCRLCVAEALLERLPIATYRSRLTFGGVDVADLLRRSSTSTVGLSGFPREAGGTDKVTEEPVFALTLPKQREARHVQRSDDTSHEVRAPSGEINSGDRCAGLPRQHHPLSGFLTLSAV
jgi:hypothetical protein